MARFLNHGTVSITTVVGPSIFQCLGLVGMNLTGATMFAHTQHWTWDMHLSGTGMLVQQCTVIGPNVYGIEVFGDGSQVTGNQVKRVSEIARLTRTGLGGECCSDRGVNVSGTDVVVQNNTPDSIGYVGIGFIGEQTRIEHNLIRRYCMTTDDGAAIYTWSDSFDKPGSAGTVIRNNLVLDAIGAPDGIPDRGTFALGIYLDDRTHHITIEGNTVSGTDIGLFVHNSRDDTVRNNLSYGNRVGQLIIQRDDIIGTYDIYGSVVRDNTLFSPLRSGPPFLERRYHANASPLIGARFHQSIAPHLCTAKFPRSTRRALFVETFCSGK